jgi:hypothetical protein
MFQQIKIIHQDSDTNLLLNENFTIGGIGGSGSGPNRTDYYIMPSRDLFIKCQTFGSVFTQYVDTSIGIIGLVLNIICFFIFRNQAFKPTRVKCRMFRYLLCKSITDGLILFFKALIPLFKCEECLLNTSYAFNVFDMIVNKYFMFVFTLCSIFFELAAQFDRLITISYVFNCLKAVSHKLIILTISCSISVFYIFKLFEYNIKNFEGDKNHLFEMIQNLSDIETTNGNIATTNSTLYIDNHNQIVELRFYYLFKSDFSTTLLFHYLDMAHSIIRDFICVLFLLIVDTLILIEFRKIMKNKKKILTRRNNTNNDIVNLNVLITNNNNNNLISISNTNITNTNNTVDQVQTAENRTTLMILIIGLANLFGRMPIFFNYLPIGNQFHLKSCYQTISETLFLVNITLNFFIYYFFNRTFKIIIDSFFFKN